MHTGDADGLGSEEDGRTDRSISIPPSVKEIRIDVSEPRVITVSGRGEGGIQMERHLKVTRKGGLVLI